MTNEGIFVPYAADLALHFNDFQLTKNFNLREFQCPCCHAVVVSRRLAVLLQRLRDRLGTPIVIASGYRCGTMNEALGADAKSLHRRGLAADAAVDGAHQENFCREAIAAGFSRAVPNIMRGFVHLEAWRTDDGGLLYA